MMVRSLLAMLTGLVVGSLILLLEMLLRTSMYPYPTGIDLADKLQLQQYYSKLPDKAFVISVAFQVIAAFSVGLISSLVSYSSKYQTGVLAILFYYCWVLYRAFSFEFPTMYVISVSTATIIFAFFGVVVGARRPV